MKNNVAWGFDLGGTQMRCALVEGSAVKSRIFRCATQRDRPSADIVNDMISLIQTAEKETGKKRLPVGMGVPTSITNGCLDTCENLPTMPNYPLAKELSQRLGGTVVLENDASCFVLGEYALFDDGVKKTLLGFTLGTSIGMGIIINGKLFKGARGQAGEIWRSPISIAGDESDASVEKDQIVDRCLGGRFLGSLYKKFSGTEISGAQIHEKAVQNDPAALQCFAVYGRRLGAFLCQAVNMFDPHAIVFGGSVSSDYAFFAPEFSNFSVLKGIQIYKTKAGDTAALLGAASLIQY
ncbi:ROK family protein [Treponema socranskii]|uniref:ROK family protein n=1 Tax=Treponema socranskii TaxID=53419 RepID=UPI00361336CC